jgi:hypothetical protein
LRGKREHSLWHNSRYSAVQGNSRNQMRSRGAKFLIFSAGMANVFLTLGTFAVWGWNSAGAHAAARNSARFAAIWFLIAFAAPALVRLTYRLPSPPVFLGTWFAAHLVHFTSVALLLAVFERGHLMQHPGRAALVVLIGAGVVFGTALTASSCSRVGVVIHNISLYAVFTLFTLAFVRNRVVALRFLALALGLALILRLAAIFKPATATAASAP